MAPGDGERGFIAAVAAAALAAWAADDAGARALLAWFPPQGERFHVGAACNIVSFAHLHAGRTEETRNVQTWAKRRDEADKRLFAVVDGRCLTARNYHVEGRLDAAHEVLRAALARAEAGSGTRAAPVCVCASFLADVLYEHDEPDAVLDTLAHRLPLVRDRVLPMGVITRHGRLGARARSARPGLVEFDMVAMMNAQAIPGGRYVMQDGA